MNKYKLYLLSLILPVFCFSCNKEPDLPPPISYQGEANYTIAELIALRTNAGYDPIPANDTVVIEGVVISSDQEGNCYKYLMIQDQTGGIQIRIDNSSLYIKYPLGQKLFVQCTGLALSDYYGLYQLSMIQGDTVERIPTAKESNFLFRDGIAGKEPEPVIIRSAFDIESSNYNTLVKLENCSFLTPGEPYFNPSDNSATSRTIVFEDRSEIILRTSSYATFATELLPQGTGSIVGFLTVYNRSGEQPQLIIRSLADVTDFSPVPNVEEITVATVDFSSNLLNNGWGNHQISGSKNWEYRNAMLSIAGTEGETNDVWLTSPALPELSPYQNVKLALTHRTPNGLGNANAMKIYYSTATPSDSFNVSEWTELTTSDSDYPSTSVEKIFNLPDNAVSNPNFRISFRYIDSRASTWMISGISFKSNVSK